MTTLNNGTGLPTTSNIIPAPPPTIINAKDWIAAERHHLLGIILIKLARLNLMLIVVTLVLACNYGTKHSWLIFGVQILSFGFNRVGAYRYHQGEELNGSYALVLSGIALIFPSALIYDEMVIMLILLGLLYVFIANMLISHKAGTRLGMVLVITAIIYTILKIFNWYDFAPDLPNTYLTAMGIIAFPTTVFIGNSLIRLNTQSTHRALNQLIDYSHQLHNANEQLGEEIVLREAANQQKLALALERERINMMTGFIRDAAHEFRTPLTVINTNLFMLKKTIAVEDQLQRLGTIHLQTQWITQLVESILEMARLDSNIPFDFSTFSINRLLENICTSFAATNKQANLHLQVDPNIPTFQADNSRLYIAFKHIIQNALEHSPSEEAISIKTLIHNNDIVIQIKDRGTGIPANVLPHIYDRFYRGDPARTQRGVGLGLSIAQKTIEHHNGNLSIKSTPGIGTVVRVTLPILKKQVTLSMHERV